MLWNKKLCRVQTHTGSFARGRCLNIHQQSCRFFFLPLFVFQGRIACANVLSDLYAMGVTECDNMLMLLGISNKMTDRVRFLALYLEGRLKQQNMLRMYLPLVYFLLKVWSHLRKRWSYWMAQFIVRILPHKHSEVMCWKFSFLWHCNLLPSSSPKWGPSFCQRPAFDYQFMYQSE